MRSIKWLLVGTFGFAAMLWSYLAWQRPDLHAPWATGVMVLAAPEEDFDGLGLPFDGISARFRLLPPGPLAAGLVESFGGKDSREGRSIRAAASEKLVELDLEQAGLGPQQLQSGRLPVPGADEVLAGCRTASKDRLQVGGRELQVVGVLEPDVALFADSYLLPPGESFGKLFDQGPWWARAAILLRLTDDEIRSPALRKQIRQTFPPERFAQVWPTIRVPRGAYYVYLAGQALLMLGGTGLFIGLYAALRRRVRWRVLQSPLKELTRRRRQLWTVHAVYFGLMIFASLVIYEAMPVQTALLGVVGRQVESSEGLLGTAGKAYGTGVIPIAAAVTFLINFLVGSLVHITLPSLIIPGAGVLMAAFRASLWGVLLAPTFSALSRASLAHSWTILLEGEGYILAAFFALLVPIHLFRPRAGGVGSRYPRAVAVNLQGALLVAAVLLAAACYEAAEVILMAG